MNTTSTPPTVILLINLAILAALGWFALKSLARREYRWPKLWYDRLDPVVQAGRTWITRAPMTFVYIWVWTVTTVIVQGTPTGIAELLARFNSTNIYGILNSPVQVLFSSAFLVAANGLGYVGYLTVFVLIVARLEHRIGSARVIVVAVASHALGSLIIVGLESWALRRDLLGGSTVLVVDVGISYVMAGAAAGYLLFVSKPWRWWYLAALVLTLVLPVIVTRDLLVAGHLFAALIGLATTWLVARMGTRPRLRWRTLVAQATPRPLPTWVQSSPGNPSPPLTRGT